MIVLCLIFITHLSATIINIPADQPTIQEGINVAVDGDTVLVQPGTYVENINYNGKNITVGSLFLTTPDTTYISQTIIDGNENGSVVKFESGEDSSAVLYGLTITNGLGGGTYPNYTGGGITCNNSNPSLKNLVITDNVTGDFGGGIYCEYSSPNLKNIVISDNFACTAGAGILCNNSSPILENVTIAGNSTNYSDGGAIGCHQNSSPSLINSILWGNFSQGVYFSAGFEPNSITISYSDIQGGESGIVTNNNGIVYWLDGNIDADPLFADPLNGDYHLCWTNFPIPDSTKSPCIDAGDPNLPLDPDSTIADIGAFYFDQTQTGIGNLSINQITESQLHQNHPNPFNPTTTISFSLQNNSNIELSIYNLKGQKVKQLVIDQLSAGEHSVVWDGKDGNNKPVTSGIYFYKLEAGDFQRVRKMILLK